ncbi:MAG: hypothetical protein COA58_05610 [Bacteroidetes bacterium]|nr:MAG: hypothetical protein COA58_05610 [Bacteroidota bacterium]
MKNITVIIILVFTSLYVNAQNQEAQNVIGVRAGFSVTGGFIKAAGKLEDNSLDTLQRETSTSNLPALSFTYDYGISDEFSVGLLTSIQTFNGSVKNYGFNTPNDTFIVENIDFTLRRIYVGIAPKYHWATSNEKVDLYSGIRLGYIIWVNNIETSDPNFDIFDKFNVGRPSFNLVPIGGNFYFDDNFGANFELAIGAPYIFSAGLQYKF